MIDQLLDDVRLGIGRVIAEPIRAADHDGIRAREQVAVAAEQVGQRRLRLEQRQVALDGMQIVVAPNVLGAEPGAVDDDVLGKGEHACHIGEGAALERDVLVAQVLIELLQEYRRLDQQRLVLEARRRQVLEGKGHRHRRRDQARHQIDDQIQIAIAPREVCSASGRTCRCPPSTSTTRPTDGSSPRKERRRAFEAAAVVCCASGLPPAPARGHPGPRFF